MDKIEKFLLGELSPTSESAMRGVRPCLSKGSSFGSSSAEIHGSPAIYRMGSSMERSPADLNADPWKFMRDRDRKDKEKD